MKTGKSFIQVQVRAEGVKESIDALRQLSGFERRRKILTNAGEAALDEVKAYYDAGERLFINPSLPTHGVGRLRTQWTKRVQEAWNLRSVVGNKILMENTMTGFAHKITGGTIKATRKKFLTIPIDPRAHGLKVADFTKAKAPLFRIKNVLAMKEKDGSISNIYALKKSVRHDPNPKALPPETLYVSAFVESLVSDIILEFEKA